MGQSIELLLETDGDKTLLLSPLVGFFTEAAAAGQLLIPGQSAGSITTIGVVTTLIIPPGCSGRVVNERFDRVHEPVAFGTLLYELEPIGDGISFAIESKQDDSMADLVVRASHAGRFWQRPSPADDAFVNVGDVIEEGSVIGLIEVMKTFTHVHYRAQGGLPPRAKVIRFLVEDGAEAEKSVALIEVEPA
ncbi:MAG: acetyl-CoA carboxylase biotin carboxyl carrier protein [Planctomycetota bacterium]|jgi:acetyl-CoA carboxylase biotin carboxyl carrier protein